MKARLLALAFLSWPALAADPPPAGDIRDLKLRDWEPRWSGSRGYRPLSDGGNSVVLLMSRIVGFENKAQTA